MSKFNRFQKYNRDLEVARDCSNAKFIYAGYPSIKIKNIADGSAKIAAVVNRQEKDMAYVFTKVDEPLEIGSVWEAKSLHLLITEEIVVIKKVEWRKYIAILCNVELEDTWGWFKGPEESYVNVALRQDVLLQSLQKPLLVLPEGTLKIGDKIVIKDRGWLIQEEDKISTQGISYYSIRPATVSKDAIEEAEEEEKEIYIEEGSNITPQLPEETEENNVRYVNPMTENTISTQNGYFKTTNSEIKVLSKTSSLVTFMLPFGVDEAEIKVKENGEIVTYIYRRAE